MDRILYNSFIDDHKRLELILNQAAAEITKIDETFKNTKNRAVFTDFTVALGSLGNSRITCSTTFSEDYCRYQIDTFKT